MPRAAGTPMRHHVERQLLKHQIHLEQQLGGPVVPLCHFLHGFGNARQLFGPCVKLQVHVLTHTATLPMTRSRLWRIGGGMDTGERFGYRSPVRAG